MKRYRTLLLPLICLLAVSCTDDKCTCPQISVSGSGNMITVTRSLPDFHSLVLASSGNVNITLGSAQVVSITVDENVLDYITTEVRDATLEIDVDDRVQLSDYSLTVNLTVTDLESIVLSGSGAIAGQNQFELDAVSIVLSGSGNITLDLDASALSSVISGSGGINLSGTVTTHATVVSGSGAVYAFNQDVDNCAAVISGSGNVEVKVASELDVVISGSGIVYYKGFPTITQVIIGTGRVENAN